MRVLLVIAGIFSEFAFAGLPRCNPIGQFVRLGHLTYTTVDFLGMNKIRAVKSAEFNTKKCLSAGARLNAEGMTKLSAFAAKGTPAFVFLRKTETSAICITGVYSQTDFVNHPWVLVNDQCAEAPDHLVLVTAQDGAYAFYATLDTARSLRARFPSSVGTPKLVEIKPQIFKDN